MTTPKWLHDTRIIKCKECGDDVPVNVNYPITEVTCQKCYIKQKSNLEEHSY